MKLLTITVYTFYSYFNIFFAGKIPHDNHSSLDSYSSNTNLPDS